jgi:FtsP/CotA-like multicopper oxidase with cupredoxin domain
MVLPMKNASVAVLFFSMFFCLCVQAQATTVEYDLTIAQEDVSIQGKTALGMTINGQIPGPTLRFTEGDVARIRVHNTMDVSTSIHWHGILVPPDMDGVPMITQAPIEPSTTFTYEIPIRQTGTYWYHSHSSLQEQSGLYGSIVIAPKAQQPNDHKDCVILLSDWTTDAPHKVLRTLKKGSEWYALEKGSAQSLFGAINARRLGDYFMRELQRMPPMDIADVAYDYFLANGKPETTIPVKGGETLRLRIIDGSATTYFHLEFAGSPMTIISADGLDVEPVLKQRFLIGVAETYDVLVTVPESGLYEMRATAHDGSGHASVWIGSGMKHPAPAIPKPNLYDSMHQVGLHSVFSLTPAGSMGMSDSLVEKGMFDRPGMMDMHGMEHGQGHSALDHPSMPPSGHTMHDSSSHQMKMAHDAMPLMEDEKTLGRHSDDPRRAVDTTIGDINSLMDRSTSKSTEPVSGRLYGSRFGFLEADIASQDNLAREGGDQRPWTPYEQLRAPGSTSYPKDKPVREIRLTLDGDMERYVWFMNNKPLSETDHILIKEGEIVRFIMINRTMMHHPMHLHGHFFRVVNSHGDHAPLKHTVDLAPMSTRVIEFYADEVGDWFFHCHLLYHMKSGMARLVHYQSFVPDPNVQAIRHRLYKDPWYFWGEAEIVSNMTEGFVTTSNTRNILTAAWEIGWEEVDTTEWEGLLTWDRYFNRFFTIFVGANFLGETNELDKTRGVIGLHYLLPLNIESRAWVDTDGGARFIFDKEVDLTPRLKLLGEAEYDTHKSEWEGSAGLTYTIHKNFSLVTLWHSDYDWGGGVRILF